MALKNLNFEHIYRDAQTTEFSPKESDLISYKEFIKYFQDIDTIEREHLVISSHFVYGWMPTIITLKLDECDTCLSLLNKAKSGVILLEHELITLKKSINNSLVGLSKLLHFVCPEKYAIWDSRIFRYLTEKKSTYGIDNPQSYIEYLKGIQDIAKNQEYMKLHQISKKHLGYDISPTRAIEFVMFETDRQRK